MKELELVGDSQVIPRLCLLLYAILFEYNIHSDYVNRSSTEHVFTYTVKDEDGTAKVRSYNAKHRSGICMLPGEVL